MAIHRGPTARNDVQQYIANQLERHRKRSYQEEFIAFLEQAGVEYDPQWLD